MGTSIPDHQWLKRRVRIVCLLSLLPFIACKHRRAPAVTEDWDSAAVRDDRVTSLPPLLNQATGLRILELFEDGLVMTDALSYRLDPRQLKLNVERRFDPVPYSVEDSIVIRKSAEWTATAKDAFFARLSQAVLREVPLCDSYADLDGGYGGRFLILIDREGREHRFGATDAACAASDHDCSGACLSSADMQQIITDLSGVLPIPEKAQTIFTCAPDSPRPCGRAETVIHGSWENVPLRSDILRHLAQGICQLDAHSLEASPEGDWLVRNGARESIGTLRINMQKRMVSCL